MFAVQAREIVVRRVRGSEALAEIAKLLAEKGVNILAMSTCTDGPHMVFRVVADDDLRAFETLARAGYNPRDVDVVLLELPHRPGMCRHVLQAVEQEGLEVRRVQAAAPLWADRCLLVLNTSDNARARVALNRLWHSSGAERVRTTVG